MKILHAASEIYPLASTGGLSSVVRALPAALNRRDSIHSAVVIPCYGQVLKEYPDIQWSRPGRTFLDEEFGVGYLELDGLRVYLVARDEFFLRDGIYGPASDVSWDDNAARFSFFSRAVSSLGNLEGFTPDIIHCHDWQTALIPVYSRNSDVRTVFTIHNIQFQGQFGREVFKVTGLPDSLYNVDALEFWGDWNCMKGGITFADAVTTVSPGYAREIMTREFGFALEGILTRAAGKVTGILNGIDTDIWNPLTDPVIPAGFATGRMSGRKLCRGELMKRMGLKGSEDTLVLGMVSRLTSQKGIDLVLNTVDWMVSRGTALAILGTGDRWAEEALLEEASAHPGKVSVAVTYDDSLARLIFAGSDSFLMPSVFEPCGLGQMMAMRYGSVPLVRSVGGLADSVTERTGFMFKGGEKAFKRTFKKMLSTWENRKQWAWYRRRCMEEDLSWESRVDPYLEVYGEAMRAERI